MRKYGVQDESVDELWAAGDLDVRSSDLGPPFLLDPDPDHPAAVLLVDLESRQVTYANEISVQLAPNTALPADVDDWSRAAGLWNEAGDDLEDSDTPLHRVAAGRPVHGEQVTAQRRSDVSAPREDLWVIGMPLSDAPGPLSRHAMIVFLPLRDKTGVRDARRASEGLQQRAILSAQVSFSISDPNQPDNPLIWVNPAFERITGYQGDDVIGTNCRFLQGPDTDRDAVTRIRQGLLSGGTVTEVLLNYRADGTPFWNHIVISPVFDAAGTLTHHVGVQSDITDRMEADAERVRALDTARQALRDAEQANHRLRTLAAISQELANRFDDGEHVIDALPRVVTGHLDGWAFAAGVDPTGAVTSLAGAHSDRGRDAAGLLEVAQSWLAQAGPELLRAALPRLGRSAPFSTTVSKQTLVRNGLGALEGPDPLAELDAGSEVRIMAVPLSARGATIGVLALVQDAASPPHDTAMIEDLGLRAGVALDNARLYAREHEAALTLQRSLLPRRLPAVDGFDVAAVYRPAEGRSAVGGDWYDVLDLPSSGLGVAVGDVVGHDLGAAAAMGQLRSILRSYAWGGERPSSVLARLHEVVLGLEMASMATCAYGIVGHDDERDVCTVTYALAGHPPPLIRRRDGQVDVLDGALTPPIGVGDVARTTDAVADLPVGSFLVLYTDGLVERRDENLYTSIDRLTRLLQSADGESTAQQLCEHIVDALVPADHEDDTCVLVIKLV